MTYKDLREQKKIRLITQYNSALKEGNYQKAYNTIRTLMKYRMITKDSDVVKKGNLTMLASHGVDVTKMDSWDYRYKSNLELIPENFLVKEPLTFHIDVKSLSHWIVRRELQYVGDQLAPDKIIHFTVNRKTSDVHNKMAYNSLKGLYKELSKQSLNIDWNMYDGSYHMYDITLSNNQSYVIRTLGYCSTCAYGKGGVLIRCLLDNDKIIEQNIDIIDTYDTIEMAFRKEFEKLKIKGSVIFEPMCDVKLIGDKQRKERKPVLSPDEFTAMKQAEYDARALEIEAEQRHMSVEQLKTEKEAMNRINDLEEKLRKEGKA